MEVLCSRRGGDVAPAPWPLTYNYFFHLKTIEVVSCPRLKVLFPLGLSVNLPNLEEIHVFRCKELEELVESSEGGEEQQQGTRNLPQFSLPKLETVYLKYLPELKWIYGGSITCNSIRYIKVLECPKLRRMPISLPLLDNGRPSPPPSLKQVTISPREWWDSVEWEHSLSEEVLRPLCFLEDECCYLTEWSSSRGDETATDGYDDIWELLTS
ncbi:hypothetical protein Tsubulata_013529 [Turnera subulata]|uniref:Disease resistance protein At4g27190-like leucine-rich repeats domain-containing protein n=1 Tax=Turnera subulata TaxID=218843 RepID=A0A9Q0GAC1_9ROSI|nr:hypothetical protein Tsubulata_013529 [Turnera subulata]